MYNKSLSYDDVLLAPQFSDIESRVEIEIGASLDDNLKFDLPIIASPMDTVTEGTMAQAVENVGGVGVIHRYTTVDEQVEMVRSTTQNEHRVGAAVGVTGDFLERAEELVAAGASFLCVDIAHGHHTLMRQALNTLRRSLGDDVHLMAGNVATLEGISAVAQWGANSVRVGIGGGARRSPGAILWIDLCGVWGLPWIPPGAPGCLMPGCWVHCHGSCCGFMRPHSSECQCTFHYPPINI